MACFGQNGPHDVPMVDHRRGHSQYGPHDVPMADHRRGYPADHLHRGDGQSHCHAMAQVQKLRSLQASEQMLYDVYEHTMGVIEELEKHEEHGNSAGYSGLLTHIIPRDRKKEKHDVTAIIEAELTCLDAQMTFAPAEVTKGARTKMLQRTLKWVAAREEKGIPPGVVDCYAKNVVQVLIKPESMKFPKRERDPRSPGLDGQTVNDVLLQYAKAKIQAEQQDKDFYENPDKKAAIRNMRQGEHERSGIIRLVNLEPNDVVFGEALVASGKDIIDLR